MHPNVLYHVTSADNLSSIMSLGLKVDQQSRGFTMSHARFHLRKVHGCMPIFLSVDPHALCVEQLTKTFVNTHRPIVLHVDVTGVVIEPEYAYLATQNAPWYDPNALRFRNTFVCKHDIEPSRLILAGKITCVAENILWKRDD